MDQNIKDRVSASIEQFRLPPYDAIPDVGLYLEQTAKYISDYLAPVCPQSITGSMISNYVKKGLISSPVRKQYSREQIAYLIFIAVAKMVMSMDDLLLMLDIQKRTYPAEIAYNYFCGELNTVLSFVFGSAGELDALGPDATDEKVMLRNMIITVAHKIYLDQLFLTLREGGQQADAPSASSPANCCKS